MTRQKSNKSHELLATLFFILGISILDVNFMVTGVYDKHPQFALWSSSLVFLYGPLLYFFTQTVLFKNFQFRKIHLLHGIPFVLMELYYVVNYHFKSIDEQRLIIDETLNKPSQFSSVVSLLILFTIIIYIYFSFRLYNSYKSKLKEKYSFIEQMSLGWVQHMLTGFCLLIVLSLLLQVLQVLFTAVDFSAFSLISLGALFVFMLASIYRGLKFSTDVSGVSFREVQKTNNLQSSRQLTDANLLLLNRITNEVFERKLFLNSSINLSELAGTINIPSRQLSELINTGKGMNFFDFINSYRIEYAKELITAHKSNMMNILEIMYESGFNSKSSFNTAFKKHVGMTPSEYRKKIG